MANLFPPVRTESRVPKYVLVELHSFENATHEITSTVNVSPHGACVLTKDPWAPHQMFPFDRSQAISIRAHMSFIANPFPTIPFPWGWSSFNPPGIGPHSANHPRRLAHTDFPATAPSPTN